MEDDDLSLSSSYPWYVWFLFNGTIGFMLYLDLRSSGSEIGRHPHPLKRAMRLSILWVASAMVFACILAIFDGTSNAATFLIGYLVEKSLSVDNLIVILLIFKHFKIRPGRQPRVLKVGIVSAVVLRAAFIFTGIRLLEMFEWTVYIFGALLFYAALKMLQEDENDQEDQDEVTNSTIVRILSAFIPYTTNSTTTRFFLRSHRTNKLVATPMFAALLVIEASDVIFAIDSIPCIIGLTHNTFIVYTSNMLAILGLRSLYLLLADCLERVKHLQTGLALVLGFVGIKMLLSEIFPIRQTYSLLAIALILIGTVLRGGVSKKNGMHGASLLPVKARRKRYHREDAI